MEELPQKKTLFQRKVFFGLFVFPLLIAVGMAALLCSIVFLTHEEETPESLITAIKTGSPSKRWQKAFELSNELNRSKGVLRNDSLMREIIHILGDKEHYDGKTRAYMAVALSRFREEDAVEALQKALQGETDDVRLYLIWALGVVGRKEAAEDILPYLKSENDDLRKMAAYVSGVLGDKNVRPDLVPLLNDAVPDVRWNSALSLARLGDDSGWEVLVKMLDRDDLSSRYQLSDAQVEKIMMNAAQGLAMTGRSESFPILENVSRQDRSLKVRQAALDAIEYQKGLREDLALEMATHD
jgi:HEAT repeat protein